MKRVVFLVAFLALASSVFSCSSTTNGEIAFDISPDGKQVVLSATDGELYLLDLVTQRLSQLTKTEDSEGSPSFSPDGSLVVYSAREKGTNGSGLKVLSLDSKRSRPLTRNAHVMDNMPSFSKDGMQITFVRANRLRQASMGGMRWDDFDIYSINTVGGEPRRITELKYHVAGSPRFTHDAKSVIYSGTVNNYPAPSHSLLLRVDVNGAAPPRSLGNDPTAANASIGAWADDPYVSPDGERVAFVSDRNNAYSYDLFLIKLNGTELKPLRVTRKTKFNAHPVFMPDGTGILFLAAAENGTYSLWQTGVDGTNPRQLASSRLFTDPERWNAKP